LASALKLGERCPSIEIQIVGCDMHAANESIVDRDSTVFSLIRRLQGGSELSSDLLVDPPRAIFATRTQSRHAASISNAMGARAPDNIGAKSCVSGWSPAISGLELQWNVVADVIIVFSALLQFLSPRACGAKLLCNVVVARVVCWVSRIAGCLVQLSTQAQAVIAQTLRRGSRAGEWSCPGRRAVRTLRHSWRPVRWQLATSNRFCPTHDEAHAQVQKRVLIFQDFHLKVEVARRPPLPHPWHCFTGTRDHLR